MFQVTLVLARGLSGVHVHRLVDQVNIHVPENVQFQILEIRFVKEHTMKLKNAWLLIAQVCTSYIPARGQFAL